MRWLLIVLLVSLGALLFAAAGLARHIWLHRTKPRGNTASTMESGVESDLEMKP